MATKNGLGFRGDQQGQAGTASMVEPPAQGNQNPAFVTVDQFKTALAEETAKILRQTQGLVDKNAGRIERDLKAKLKSVDDNLALMKSNGIEVPQEKVDQMKSKVIAEAYAAAGEPAPDVPPVLSPSTPPAQVEAPDEVNPITAQGRKILKAFGLNDITEDDPEYSLIDHRTEDAGTWLASVTAAAQAKQARIKQALNTPPGAIIPAPGSSQVVPGSLKDRYDKEIAAAHGPNAIIEIKKRYRSQGLNI